MSTTYICKKCDLKTINYCDIKKHLCNKNECSRNLFSYNYSDDQLLILTLLPYYKNNHIIEEKEIEHLKNENLIYKNKSKLLNILDNIDKNKLKKCTFCNQEFTKNLDLRKHILLSCFYEELNKKDSNLENIIINSNNTNTNSNNINSNNTNITNSNNVNNITNIYLEIKTPIPFDEDWDISNISENSRSGLLVSQFMYTKLLEEILSNEINLNIIIDKDDESGIVYKNNDDKYISMKSKDIAKKTMDKLNKHLTEMNKADTSCYENYIVDSRRTIRKKYIDYNNIEAINNGVNQCLKNILSSKKNDAINISKNINQNLNISDNVNVKFDKGF